MQPIGPFFLFLFLPISLLFIALAKQQRAVVTSLFSLLYVVLLNLHTPIGLFMMAAVILLARLATLKPLLLRARPLSLFLGVLLPLSLLVSARVLLPRVAFPFGITVLTLLAISTVIDACRDGYVPPKNVLVFAGTLCFFPLLAVGPLVRGKDMTALFGDQRITLKRVFDGIRLYTLGAIHIYIVAAPLYFIYQKITETFGTRIDIFSSLCARCSSPPFCFPFSSACSRSRAVLHSSAVLHFPVTEETLTAPARLPSFFRHGTSRSAII